MSIEIEWQRLSAAIKTTTMGGLVQIILALEVVEKWDSDVRLKHAANIRTAEQTMRHWLQQVAQLIGASDEVLWICICVWNNLQPNAAHRLVSTGFLSEAVTWTTISTFKRRQSTEH
jgi:hypothetical protein